MANEQNGQKPTYEQLAAKLAELQAALDAKNNREITFHVNQEKGGIGIFGFNKQFPISLYANQVPKLAELMPKIIEFAKRHEAILSVKGEPADVAAAKLAKRAKLAADKTVDSVTKLAIVKIPGKAPVQA